MSPKLKKIIEEIDKVGYIQSFKRNKNELTHDFLQKERELKIQCRNIGSKVDKENLSNTLIELEKKYNLLSELDIEYDIKINHLSNKLYKSIEKNIGSKISYETFSSIMRHYNLKDFLTKEISTIAPAREEPTGRIIDYDYYNKQTISELKTEIAKIKRTSENENDLITAQRVLSNKLQQNLINDKQKELLEFKKDCSSRESDELKRMVFDESDSYTSNEKSICRAILKKRYHASE